MKVVLIIFSRNKDKITLALTLVKRRINMSYDINLLVVGQKEPSIVADISSIKIISELTEQLRYYEIWRFMTRTEGIWYNIGIDLEGTFSALPLLNAEFDSKVHLIPYWIDGNEDIKSNLVPLGIKPRYKKEVEKLLESLVNESPVQTVYFMARMQGGDDEVICGTLSLDDFWNLHDTGRILFNVCYIIHK